MTDQPADSYCKGCKFLILRYELEDRQYYFGCEKQVCMKEEVEEDNNE